MKLSPLIKGIITAVLMIATSLFTFYTLPPTSPLHYLVFAVYALGIIWTLAAFSKSPESTGKFGGFFNTGFRCFIVATLLMVVYTFTFNKLHPEFAEESALVYKKELVAAQLQASPGHKTPTEIEEAVARYKKGYTMALVYGSIFGYLIIGAVVTALASVILTRRK